MIKDDHGQFYLAMLVDLANRSRNLACLSKFMAGLDSQNSAKPGLLCAKKTYAIHWLNLCLRQLLGFISMGGTRLWPRHHASVLR